MNDDQYLLASAYADGEVTPAERALAEADPAVMAEVERLQALRGALREVTPSGAQAAMIAAAMNEFHAARATVPEPARPAASPVVAARRPSRWFTWERGAALAAAAVAVVAIGAVVTSGSRGGGDDDSAAEMANTMAIASDAADATAVPPAPADQDRMTIEAAPEATLAAAATEAPAVMAEPADGAGDAAEVTSDTAEAPTGAGRTFPVIESPEQLAAAGLELRDAYAVESSEGDDAVAATDCTFTAAVESPLAIPEAEQLRDELPELAERVELLDLREYRVGPGDDRSAWIAVDLDTGQAFAIDATRCALLAVGPLP